MEYRLLVNTSDINTIRIAIDSPYTTDAATYSVAAWVAKHLQKENCKVSVREYQDKNFVTVSSTDPLILQRAEDLAGAEFWRCVRDNM